ncbi:SDR family NAD(P)-dependent oxidoreductase [Lapidilactobacillus gannanensis]|jgi:short-subunit dehydrogenase|uniref:SDR family NAD(P)-dependent oxidoreductase n=1 Tax=Lapidilactobacillus gannanensis TaxID=2486002 RepID=A0ABW4BRG4_9LACO|nr:SDR family oxidoreductase [Lapidilactobacillus gannanensis]MCH4057411.1 SDR family oxidoreductase [Lactobacillaceae bacterium]
MVAQTKDLSDQVVVVTGASSGIGRAVALEAASRGARLFLLARRVELLEEVKVQCERLSLTEATVIAVDLSDLTSLEAAVATIKQATDQINVLVNAAGFGDFELFTDIPVAKIQKMFAVNILGLMILTRELVPLMFAPAGHIISLGSMAGKLQTPKSAVYAATKAAVIAFSNSLRLELRPLGVKVTTVNPGPVKTDFFATADQGNQYLAKIAWLSLDAEHLAQRIVNSFGRNVREINAPWFMEVAARLYPLVPQLGDYLAGTLGNQK